MISAIYITDGQYKKVLANVLNKNKETNDSKYPADAFLDKRIFVKFVNGYPVSIFHKGINIGQPTVYKLCDTDIEFPIHKAEMFDKFRKTVTEFYLSVSHEYDCINKSCVSIAYDMNWNKLRDFTNIIVV